MIYKQSQAKHHVGQYVSIIVHEKGAHVSVHSECYSTLSSPSTFFATEKYLASTVMGWLQPIILLSPALLVTGEGGRTGNEETRPSLGWSCGWGKGVGVFVFFSHHSTLVLIGHKLNFFSPTWVCLAYDGNWEVISLCLSWPIWFSILLFFSVLLRWGVREEMGGCLEADSTHHQYFYILQSSYHL